MFRSIPVLVRLPVLMAAAGRDGPVVRACGSSTVECQIKPRCGNIKSGKWLKLYVAAPPVSQAFGHVESSRLVPRGAHSSPITIQQKHN